MDSTYKDETASHKSLQRDQQSQRSENKSGFDSNSIYNRKKNKWFDNSTMNKKFMYAP